MLKTLSQKRAQYIKSLSSSTKQIVPRLAHLNPDRISIFGSYASGKADLLTDLDILVVMNTDKPYIERSAEIHSLLALPVDYDVLCYTPEEFNTVKNKPFLKHALRNEVVLYEKKPA